MRGSNIGLALQGGGSYAAFTSGVLTALLDKRRGFLAAEQIHSIGGTSGGALNALLLGWAIHEKQKNPLTYVQRLWRLNRLETMLKEQVRALQLVPDEVIATLVGMSRQMLDSSSTTAHTSPKLRSQLLELVDEMIHAAAPSLPTDPEKILFKSTRPYVTVAATEVRTAVAHYFTNNRRMIRKFERFAISDQRKVIRDLSLLGVYASLAHPRVFNPVEIGDGLYWDGYYTCNPPFVYLFREGCDEVVLVRLIQQERRDLDREIDDVADRIEEIVQNTTINMEIMAYLAMREIALTSRGGNSTVNLKLGLKQFNPAAVYHEIRLLKPGHIADEGFPLGDLVDKLIRLGRKVVADRSGFAARYRAAEPGLQVVSEIDYESERVSSRMIDIDQVLFQERGGESHDGESSGAAERFVRFFKDLI